MRAAALISVVRIAVRNSAIITMMVAIANAARYVVDSYLPAVVMYIFHSNKL